MGLSAEDVHARQFKLVRNATGYDMAEVDEFLDDVESEIARLSDQLERALEGVAAAEAGTDSTAAAATRILEVAQHTADEYVGQAKRRADAMVADAEKAARKSVKRLEAQRAEVEQRLATLQALEAEVRSRLTGYLQSHLADLSALAGPGDPDRP